jgi:hypothetical protein
VSFGAQDLAADTTSVIVAPLSARYIAASRLQYLDAYRTGGCLLAGMLHTLFMTISPGEHIRNLPIDGNSSIIDGSPE